MSHFPCQPQGSCTLEEKTTRKGVPEGLGNDILALHSCNTSMTCALEIHSESFYLFNKIFIILLFTTSDHSEKSKCLTLLLKLHSGVGASSVELSRVWVSNHTTQHEISTYLYFPANAIPLPVFR